MITSAFTSTGPYAILILGVRLLDHLIIGSPESEDGRGFVSIFERMEDDIK